MKKVIKTTMLIVTIALMLTAVTSCKSIKKEKNDTSSKSANSQTSSVNSSKPATTSSMGENFRPNQHKPTQSEKASTVTNDLTPMSELKKYTLVMPDAWLDKVDYIEDENVVKVYHRQSRAKNIAGESEYDGLLFTIVSMTQAEYDAQFTEVPGKIIGQLDDTVAVWIRVSDVRADPENMDMFNDYMAMQGEVETILGTIKFWPD